MYYFSITDILQAAASAAIAALCDKHRENQDRVKQAGAIMWVCTTQASFLRDMTYCIKIKNITSTYLYGYDFEVSNWTAAFEYA